MARVVRRVPSIRAVVTCGSRLGDAEREDGAAIAPREPIRGQDGGRAARQARRARPAGKKSAPPVTKGRDRVPAAEFATPEFFLNRELTWLEFNRRVLHEAEDTRTPLLERVKFLAIVELQPRRVLHEAHRRPEAAGRAPACARPRVDGRTPRQQIVECYAVIRGARPAPPGAASPTSCTACARTTST